MKKKKKSKSFKKTYQDTILIIVENSEVEFFNKYLKKLLKEKNTILIRCESSGNKNTCEILNFKKITKRVNYALIEEKYKAVFLLIDLKTNCRKTNKNHKCLIKLKKEYLPEYKIEENFKNNFYLFVVCNEIESWFLTIDPNRSNTNNISEDHKKEIKLYLNIKKERAIVDKITKGLINKEFQLNFSKNKSLEFFINKLKEFNENL